MRVRVPLRSQPTRWGRGRLNETVAVARCCHGGVGLRSVDASMAGAQNKPRLGFPLSCRRRAQPVAKPCRVRLARCVRLGSHAFVNTPSGVLHSLLSPWLRCNRGCECQNGASELSSAVAMASVFI